MPFQETEIKGLWIFEPRLFEDNRGYFFESYNHRQFVEATGFEGSFVQDNHSLSYFGVMRGLHLQLPPYQQSKLIRVIEGEVLDVAVDVRKDSPTYGKHFSIILSAQNKRQLFIPVGFAHGFVVLSQNAELLYKCDNYYAPQAESGILFNDSDLKINWQIPEDKLIISEKDLALPTLANSKIAF
jgi:dTDP-4-dehydrorhamnose 3,5-epimerase